MKARISATTPTPNTAASCWQQPGSYAWQVFDSQVLPLLRDEYKMRGATKVRADSLEELVDQMQDVNPAGFIEDDRATTTPR